MKIKVFYSVLFLFILPPEKRFLSDGPCLISNLSFIPLEEFFFFLGYKCGLTVSVPHFS